VKTEFSHEIPPVQFRCHLRSLYNSKSPPHRRQTYQGPGLQTLTDPALKNKFYAQCPPNHGLISRWLAED